MGVGHRGSTCAAGTPHAFRWFSGKRPAIFPLSTLLIPLLSRGPHCPYGCAVCKPPKALHHGAGFRFDPVTNMQSKSICTSISVTSVLGHGVGGYKSTGWGAKQNEKDLNRNTIALGKITRTMGMPEGLTEAVQQKHKAWGPQEKWYKCLGRGLMVNTGQVQCAPSTAPFERGGCQMWSHWDALPLEQTRCRT